MGKQMLQCFDIELQFIWSAPWEGTAYATQHQTTGCQTNTNAQLNGYYIMKYASKGIWQQDVW